MKRILVIATRQIGDVLLTTPLIRATRRRWPDAHIDVLGFDGQMGMLAGNPDINRAIPTPVRLGLKGGWRLARQLWRRYDLALVSQPGDRAHLLGWIAAPCRSGLIPEGGSSNWWKQLLLRYAVVSSGDRGDLHVVPEKLRLLDPWPEASLPRETPPTSVTIVAPAGEQLPDEVVQQLHPEYLVVHAPSMWRYKQWPDPYWSALVSGLLKEGRQIVLTGSASERDQACLTPLRRLGIAPALIDVSGRLNFGQLLNLIKSASLYIGPDTSISHLAAASGTPCLAIFGPTNPQRWGPWPGQNSPSQGFERHAAAQELGNVTVLQGPQSCVPCGRAGCEDHHDSRSDCLMAIAPEVVLARANALLGRR